MKALYKFAVVLVLSYFIVVPILALPVNALSDAPVTVITEWEMKWEENSLSTAIEAASDYQEESGWFPFKYGEPDPEKPADIHSAWLRFQLPDLTWTRPAILISKLTATDVDIFIDNQVVYESHRDYPFTKNEILLPLSPNESKKFIYIKLETERNWLGLKEQLVIGEHDELKQGYMKRDILDVILGASLIFISLSMLLGITVLNKSFMIGWNSLCVIILSLGLMIVTYSPFLHTNYPEIGLISYYLFDISSTLFMASIFIFFEKIFGKGPFGIISIFKRIQIIIALSNTILLLLGFFFDIFKEWQLLAGTLFFGLSIIVGNILLVGFLVFYCRKGNKDAIILTTGFGIFAVIGVAEVSLYFIKSSGYSLFLWKWGILFFIASLIIILARRVIHNYEQVVRYSQKLEIFNNELQRSEKMEIISQLAASVAHEVRNPLQVTRGFLQLLGEKTVNDKDKGFLNLAMNELDRASEIITDFLTFAKPQVDQITLLHIANELSQIEGMLVPLATMQGATFHVDLSPDLFIKGNSSKLKQALINIIKNSIEALGEDGEIRIHAYEELESKMVIIRIKDNGEGISEEDLKRLGEPYYSNKTKGTGLGLMVTFRIIEAMHGKIQFISKKGEGTEAIIYFPSGKNSINHSIAE